MSPTTLVRGRLRDHPLWSRALAAPEIVGRLIQPVIVSARVEDRERVPDDRVGGPARDVRDEAEPARIVLGRRLVEGAGCGHGALRLCP